MDTLVALRGFHAGERSLFDRLLNLGEDPFLSKKIMAFWLWLESVGYHDLLQRIQSHSDRFLLLIAAEAETCLSCLETNTIRPLTSSSSSGNCIPITASLTEQPLSLALLERHRQLALTGISHILNGVCALVFDDIVVRRGIGAGEESSSSSLRSSNSGGGGYSAALSGAGLSTVAGLYNPWSSPFHVMNPPLMSQHPREGEGSELVAVRSTLLHVGSSAISPLPAMDHLNPMVRPWTLEINNPTSEEQRCLFVTFSRGYPLSRGEIIDFFTQ